MTLDDFRSSPRIIDVYPTHYTTGPRLVVFGAVHGNEPSGVIALRQVFEQLRSEQAPLQGQLIGIMGNIPAFDRQVRYCDADLNRLFRQELIQEAEAQETSSTVEMRELREICTLAKVCEADTDGKPFFVDCHTTSAASVPYVSLNEGFADSFRFAQDMPAVKVIGAEREIKGCLSEWLNRRGWHGFTLEAGQHQADISVRNQAAIIWLGLLNSGCLSDPTGEVIQRANETLLEQGDLQASVFQVTASYRIREGETFRMEPGYANFQAIRQGELLATSNGEPVYAFTDAFILMPLYQPQGNFGYFIAQKVR